MDLPTLLLERACDSARSPDTPYVPQRPTPVLPLFLFATGVENSNPVIKNGRVRIDQMDLCGHYEHWETDFDLVQEMGLSYLRYGPPLHRTWLGDGKYDWSFADKHSTTCENAN